MEIANILTRIFNKSDNRRNSSTLQGGDITEQAHDAFYIPYACHYSDNLLLCKDGKLVGTIQINDFCSNKDLRSILRDLIAKHIDGNANIAIWIHFIRSKDKQHMQWNDCGDFSDDLHKSLVTNKAYALEYSNTLYISFSIESFNKIPLSPMALQLGYIKKHYSKKLSNSAQKLNSAIGHIIDGLSDFSPHRLSVDHETTKSELLCFLNKIIYLKKNEDRKITFTDIAQDFVDRGLFNFGFNTFEVKNDGKSKFSNILAIKDYNEVSAANLNTFTQINADFFITEIINFANCEQEEKYLKQQQYLFSLSKDEKMAQYMVIDSETVPKLCKHDITITTIADSIAELVLKTQAIVHSLSLCGFKVVRHDLGLEAKFWGSLPGSNYFAGIKLNAIIPDRTCGFVNLHNHSSGMVKGATGLFWSIYDSPYFFNFNNDYSHPHCMILGSTKYGRTILQNLLISEARMVYDQVIIVDYQQKSRVFINAINGQYFSLFDSKPESTFRFNPLKIEDSTANRIIMHNLGTLMQQEDPAAFAEATFAIPIEERSIESVIGEDEVLKAIFCDNDNIAWQEDKIGIDLTNLYKQSPELIKHLLPSLIARIVTHTASLSKPILVLEEPWIMQSYFHDEESIRCFFTKIEETQSTVIFTAGQLSSKDTDGILSSLINEYLGTKIFVPGCTFQLKFEQIFNLSAHDINLVKSIKNYHRHFLIKQGKEPTILRLDLTGLKEVYLLSSSNVTIKAMDEAMNETGYEAKQWIPKFYEKCGIES